MTRINDSSHRKGRLSGGIYVLVEQKIRQQIKSAGINRNYEIWFKIDKNTMKSDKHYILEVYTFHPLIVIIL